MTTEQRTLDRIDRKISSIILPPKPRWVKYGFIKKLTGFNSDEMKRARKQNLIAYKKDNGIWYDMNSIPKEFIKTPA